MSKRNEDKETNHIFLHLFIGTIALVILAVYFLFRHYYDLMDTEKVDNTETSISMPDDIPDPEELMITSAEREEAKKEERGLDSDVQTIMLVCVSSTGEDMSGSAEAIVLLSVNSDSKEVVFTSFLKDIYAEVPGYGYDTLANAQLNGGTDLLKDTLKADFGIPVDNEMVINADFVKDFSEAVGGVSVDLTADGSETAQIAALSESFSKLKEMGIFEINGVINEFLPRISTDLKPTEALSLLVSLTGVTGYTTDSLIVPVEGSYSADFVNGEPVLNVDYDLNSDAWFDRVDN